MNDWGGRKMLADPTNIGVGHSGSGNVLGDGEPVIILAVNLPQILPGGCDGLATVHVSARDISVIPPGQSVPNSMLILSVNWQSGIGGGEFEIDATQGVIFTVGATQVVHITARLESAILDTPLVPWASKRVEATVKWYGNVQCQSLMSLPTVAAQVVEGSPVPTVFQRIPRQARSMIALTTVPSALPTITAEFSTTDDPSGSGIKYATLNPNANGTPIVHGVEWVRFKTTTVQTGGVPIFAVFEMWP